MKKFLVKMLTFAMAFVMLFSLVACGDEKEDATQKELDGIMKNFMIKGLDKVTGNFELQDKVATIYTITWELSESKYAKLGKTRAGNPVIVVTSPTPAEDWQTLTLKASITSNERTASKEFEVLLSPVTPTEYKTAAQIIAAETNDKVAIKGLVTLIIENKGFWVKDDTGSVYVYVNGKVTDLYAGDEVSVSGTKTVYYSLTEVENPSVTVTKYVEGTFDFAAQGTAAEVSALTKADSTATARFGSIFNVEGTVIKDTNSGGTYTYALKDYKNPESITLYDSSMTSEALATLKLLEGQYVKMSVLLWDFHSAGYFRFVPVNSTIVKTDAPIVSEADKVAAGEKEVLGLAGNVYADMTLPAKVSGFEDATITWVSATPAVLGNDGKLGTSTNVSEEVTLTATVKCGTTTKDVEVKVTVWFITLSTIQSINQKLDVGTIKVAWIEGQIIGFDKNGEKPFIADGTGVIVSNAKIDKTAFKVGDSVKIIGEVAVYTGSGKQYTRQISKINSIEKLETPVEIIKAAKLDLAEIVGKKVAATDYVLTTDEVQYVKDSNYYGYLYEITGYVVEVVSGSYTNYYIASDTTTGTSNVLYYYSNAFQTEIAAFAGKKVTMVAPMYDFSGQYGWRIGAYVSIEEKEGTVDPTPANTVLAARSLAKDAAAEVVGQITNVYAGNGFFVKDATGVIFVYVKGDTSAYLPGSTVLVKGKAGNYNGPQIASPVITTLKYGTYTQNPVAITVDDFIALTGKDAEFGAEYKLTAKVVQSGNYINFELKAAVGETKAVTAQLNLTADQKTLLATYVDKTVTLNVCAYNIKSGYPFNLFLLDSVVTEVTE